MKYRLDVTNEKCPMTYVKARLELDKLESGDRLEVLVNPGEPLRSIPQTAEGAGYKIIEIAPCGDKHLIVIEK
jgi:tRNA 2-thiouridine synthesizing protein A